jgi:hypothetical protein
MIKNEIVSFLIDEDTVNTINNENQKELIISEELQSYVEGYLLIELNKLADFQSKSNEVNQALFILFAQGIKSYKTSLLLTLNGYYSNAIILARNLIEIIFNIKFILNNPNTSNKIARQYLENPKKWTNKNISERAYETLDKPLYELYKLFSNYTHSNYLGTSQNFSTDNTLSIYPTDKKSKETINCINSLYYHQIQIISGHYGLEIAEIEMTDEFKKMMDFYNIETNLIENLVSTNLVDIPKDRIMKDMKKYRSDINRTKGMKRGSNPRS